MFVVVMTCTTISAVLTYCLASILVPGFALQATAIGIIVPMVIAPPVLMVLLHLLRELDHAEVKYKQMAVMDELTGAFNRHYLAIASGRIVSSAMRNQLGLAAAMLDIDCFKSINDTYGHHVGDLVLTEFKRRVETCLRPGDLLVRLGGDEFLILLAVAGQKAAFEVGERLRQVVGDGPFLENDLGLALTTTVGIAYLKEDENSLDGLIRRADAMLYKGKKGGRNMVVAE